MAIPCPKPKHKRRTPTRKDRGAFTQEVMDKIFERDGGCCVRCRVLYDNINTDLEMKPHHIIFRSQGGPGTVDNGVCICKECHRLAHRYDEVRRWFERYREQHLLVKFE